jgi:PHP domain
VLTNADVGELLWRASRQETDHRRRALERASRASRFWPEEVHDLAAAGRPLTELRAVGPWVAAQIETWLEDPPPVPETDETRRGFLTYAEVRSTLNADPTWESLPCADLQIHTTYSDGAVSLEDMIGAARVLGRSFVAITDHLRSFSHRALFRPQQAEETAQEQVEDRPEHGGALSKMAAWPTSRAPRSSFWTPTPLSSKRGV